MYGLRELTRYSCNRWAACFACPPAASYRVKLKSGNITRLIVQRLRKSIALYLALYLLRGELCHLVTTKA
jgi:hypothetical protein